ncbi:MAG: endonuclease MutS2 [Firmicutes bacterium]|nr:endonuclease MutS2 [Bacillota bacterium]
MDARSMRLLELDKVLTMLKDKCVTTMGSARVEALVPAIDRHQVKLWQSQTREAVTLLGRAEPALSGLVDISSEAIRAGKGGILEPLQLFRIARFLDASAALKRLLGTLDKDSYLALTAQSLLHLPDLSASLRRAVDEEGNVLDTASPELRSIRRKLDNERSRLRDKLDSMVKSPTIQKYLQEPLVTQRGERYCLPVKSECRGQVPGVVHDQSASGATLFIEPMAVVDINNGITQLQRQEQAEVQRILRELSNQVGSYSEDLVLAVESAGEADFIIARGKLALAMDAMEPEISEGKEMEIVRGRHPLLPAKEVVPSTINLGKDFNALVITGPNTGGKTVTLKTVGLLCLMAQAGLWLPADKGTVVPVYTEVFADIGDEQSIEQSLSTFSSHMTNIVGIIESAGPQSLVLLDELGAGTDPTEGAALAISILEHLRGAGCSLVATTHYSELKAYAWTEDGVENASVEFDVETLRPTYRLLIGTPGKSNAFEIATRLGLQQEIVQRARSLLGGDVRRTEDMLAALEASRVEAEKKLVSARNQLREANATREQYEMRLQKLEAKQDEIIEAARQKANELVRSARLRADELLTELRQAQSENVDELARRVREDLKPTQTVRKQQQAPGEKPDPSKLKPGQTVKVASLDKTGNLLSIGANEAQVQVGIMKINVALDDLRLIREAEQKKTVERHLTKAVRSELPLDLDLRGITVEEAILQVDKYLDAALLAGYEQVSLIHGKGTGALGRGLQDYLKTHPAVQGFRYGGAGEGGSGVTVVSLKK